MAALQLPPLGVDEALPILRKNKLSTGNRELDIILEGGYENPGSVLIKGPPGMEKAAFAFHFASAKKDDFVVFIAADAAPTSIIERASSIGINIESDNVKFIDCYSATISTPSQSVEGAGFVSVPGPTALNDLSLAINEMIKAAEGKKLRVIFYSLSAFLLYNQKESILKFLQVVGGRLKNASATILFLVEEDVHEKALLTSVERLMDQRFTLRTGKDGYYELEIAELGATIQLRLGPNGILIP